MNRLQLTVNKKATTIRAGTLYQSGHNTLKEVTCILKIIKWLKRIKKCGWFFF